MSLMLDSPGTGAREVSPCTAAAWRTAQVEHAKQHRDGLQQQPRRRGGCRQGLVRVCKVQDPGQDEGLVPVCQPPQLDGVHAAGPHKEQLDGQHGQSRASKLHT